MAIYVVRERASRELRVARRGGRQGVTAKRERERERERVWQAGEWIWMWNGSKAIAGTLDKDDGMPRELAESNGRCWKGDKRGRGGEH